MTKIGVRKMTMLIITIFMWNTVQYLQTPYIYCEGKILREDKVYLCENLYLSIDTGLH